MKPAGLLLTPGAGTSCDHPSLVAIEDAFEPDLAVRRVDFPYRREGRRFPDRAPKLVAFVREEATAFAADLGVDTERLLLGGRSMGGRMCSIAVAEGLPVAGLVLISYPLHPPKKPENLRVDHFGQIDVPCLFISGTKDEFGTPEEFDQHLAAVVGPVTQVWLDNKRHDLKGADEMIIDAMSEWVRGL